ncbi:2-amino-4-hydroxy-6-hydroxymethyldihydropteridine diphosphokinase [Plantibacter sp. YIM 135347]|uniref:2-amino-4-hydroxy-6- hydroxymethyldihydropteridine diphosphokinase n=1 Tax=Plantibacter sp. YIM 135347 TaxID=3423919 RepID=UPI003D33758A
MVSRTPIHDPQRRLPVPRGGAEVDAVVAFGSNLGDREATIHAAVAQLELAPGIASVRLSPLVSSAAVKLDGVDQSAPAYLNGVAVVRTNLDPHHLLDALHIVEQTHGRVREERWGDRTLDLDIVTYGASVIDDERLTVPHPRAAERGFVLVPWLLLDADAELPGIGRVDTLPAATDDSVTVVDGDAR